MRTAIEQVEDAADLLKHLPARAWLVYLAGAAPLTLTVLWFAREMLSGYLTERCLPESFLCAIVFFFAAFMKARFARELAARLEDNSEKERRSSGFHCALVQGCLQALKLVALPLATLSLIPLPWVSAVFRNVNELANEKRATLAGTIRQAAIQASWQARAMTAAFLLCSVAACVLFINVFLIAIFLPQLLKAFTGLETEGTRIAGAWASGNLFRVALGVTWLLIDPLLQACAAIRNFEYRAQTDGLDLLVRLKRLAAAAAVAIVVMSSATTAGATERASITAEEMARAVEKAKGGDEYAWARAAKGDDEEKWFGARIARDARRFLAWTRDGLQRFAQWVERLFAPKNPSMPSRETASSASALMTKWLVYGLTGLIAIAGIAFFVKTRSKPRVSEGNAQNGEGRPREVDVAGDLTGSELEDEEWLAAARGHAALGEWRLSLRAMHLANVAYLGRQQMITVQRSKTNGLYERELRSRCRTASIKEAFARANRVYERVWYGMHEATPEMHDAFEGEVKTVRGFA